MDLLKVFQTESIETIIELIISGGIPQDLEWLNYAALSSALENGRIDVAELLLKRNCCVNSFSSLPLGTSPLHSAVKLGDSKFVINLLMQGAFISTVDADGNTPLHLAFLYKHKHIVDIILDFMVQTAVFVNVKNAQGLSHLHIACTGNTNYHVRVVESYLKAGVQIADSVSYESVMWAGFTALHFAVEFKSLTILKVLAKEATKADYDKKDSKGRTARELLKHNLEELMVMDKILSQDSLSFFELTCLQDKENSSEVLNSFIKHGVDVNSQMGRSNSFCPLYTPLHLAVASGNPANVKVLLENKANSQIQNAKLMTPLHQAFYHENSPTSTKIVDLLYVFTCDKEVIDRQDVNGLNYLHIACARNDVTTVKKILSSGKDINCEISYDREKLSRYTPLHFAVKYKHLQMAKLLLKCGADVNVNPNSVHGTPLHLAFLVGHVDMGELLLANGANPKAICTVNGATTLHVLVDCCVNRLGAALDDNVFVSYVEKLIDRGVDVNAQDSTGFTALHVACTGYGPICVSRLLKFGADVNVKNKNGKTPFEMVFDDGFRGQDRVLYYVIFYEHVQKLKDLGMTVRAKNDECCQKVLDEANEMGPKVKTMLSEKISSLEKQRMNEIARMKSTKINDQVSLFDFLKFRPKRAANFVGSNALLKIFSSEGSVENEYPSFGYFIRMQYRRGVIKQECMEIDDDGSTKMSVSLSSKVED